MNYRKINYKKFWFINIMNFMKETAINKEEKSVIAYLLKYDDIMKGFFNEIRKAQSLTGDVQLFTEDINQKIKDSFEDIKNEMSQKFQNILEYIRDTNNKITNDALKFRYEIDILIKNNSELVKQINELKSQIKKMEDIIGKSDIKQMSFTK